MNSSRRREPRFNKLFLVLSIAWIVFVLYLNSQPGSTFSGYRFRWWHAIPHFDKWVHFGLYGVMTALLWNAVLRVGDGFRPPVRHPVFFIAFVPAFVGVLDEFHQVYVPGRSADIYDLLVDWLAIGVVIAVGFIFSRSWREK